MTSHAPDPFHLTRIAEVMARHRVRYVFIGGVSGLLHGATEYQTKDVDLLVQDVAENRSRLAAAMTELEAVPAGTTDRRPISGHERSGEGGALYERVGLRHPVVQFTRANARQLLGYTCLAITREEWPCCPSLMLRKLWV